MIAREPIIQLAQTLRRVRSGEGTAAEVVQWLRAAGALAADIPKPQHKPAHRNYTRTLLFKDEAFEVLALHWTPNCTSAIHDHGGALCWLAVARGAMHVENYLRTDSGTQPGYAAIAFDGREDLGPGSIDHRQDDVHLHRCIADDCETVSLHVYAHPIERFHGFDEISRRCFDITSTYDAIASF
ncbi:MAG TPA: cysteine dioxygenase family protein [Candidatus Baltobacteraceae bacterium]|nr:cysteine dioxygenase family protein [Candidatus Baltobacteraceae bacterium]